MAAQGGPALEVGRGLPGRVTATGVTVLLPWVAHCQTAEVVTRYFTTVNKHAFAPKTSPRGEAVLLGQLGR